MPGYWLSEPIQKRERSYLHSVDFPTCTCHLYFTESPSDGSTLQEAMEAALTRQEIDTLLTNSKSLRSAEEGDYIRRLFLQDLDWEAVVAFHQEPDTDIQLSLDILALFKPVRHLALNKMDRRWLPLLISFPNVVELDLTTARYMRPSNFTSFCEYDSLVKNTLHVQIKLNDQDDASMRFPAAAKNHWRSLLCNLDGYSAELFLDLSRQVAQLNALKYLELPLGTESIDYSEAIQTLSAWIGSPSCGLSHLSIASFTGSYEHKLPLASSLKLIRGIGQNRSIQEFEIGALSCDLNWSTDVLPEIAKSSIHHLLIMGDDRTHILEEDMLRKWMLQMRSTRLISVLQIPHHRKVVDIVAAESRLHIRWKRIWRSTNQFGQTIGSPNCSFLTTLPPCCWARALEQFDVTDYSIPFLPIAYDGTILDMTFFVLQRWLTSMPDFTCPVSRKRRASDSEEE